MDGIKLLPAPWSKTFAWFTEQIQENVLLVSPFIKLAPIARLCESLARRNISHQVNVTLITNLSPSSLVQGVLEPVALTHLMDAVPQSRVIHLPRLHAKVYVADSHAAIITSGNLTASGIESNYEYGVCIQVPKYVEQARRDVETYAQLGAVVSREELQNFAAAAEHVRELQERAQRETKAALKRALKQALARSEQPILQARARAESENHTFAQTILYLLQREGALSTAQMHPFIQSIHPDLCSDEVDRVINGINFGRRWKHMVRNAQLFLRRRGDITYDAQTKLWKLNPNSSLPSTDPVRQ